MISQVTSRPATRTDTQALQVADSRDLIRVQGARVNNLKDISLEIPKRRLTVASRSNPCGLGSLHVAQAQQLAGDKSRTREGRKLERQTNPGSGRVG
jgi:hypothetical protein